jgi:hypothetical protein
MSRSMYIEDTEFFRSFLVSPDETQSVGPYGPYSTPGTAKGIATRNTRWRSGWTTKVQQLMPVMYDGELMLGWFDIDE